MLTKYLNPYYWLGSEKKKSDEDVSEQQFATFYDENFKKLTDSKNDLSALASEFQTIHDSKVNELKSLMQGSAELIHIIELELAQEDFSEKQLTDQLETNDKFKKISYTFLQAAVLDWFIKTLIPFLQKNEKKENRKQILSENFSRLFKEFETGIGMEKTSYEESKNSVFSFGKVNIHKFFEQLKKIAPSSSMNQITLDLKKSSQIKSSDTTTDVQTEQSTVSIGSSNQYSKQISTNQTNAEKNPSLTVATKLQPIVTTIPSILGKKSEVFAAKQAQPRIVNVIQEFKLSSKDPYSVEAKIDVTEQGQTKVIGYKYEVSQQALNNNEHRLKNITETLLRGRTAGAFEKGVVLRGSLKSVADTVKVLHVLNWKLPVSITVNGQFSFEMDFNDPQHWQDLNLEMPKGLYSKEHPVKQAEKEFKQSQNWPEKQKNFEQSFVELYKESQKQSTSFQPL